MQLECPKCGGKLSAFDREETEACPVCGVRLSGESRTTDTASTAQPSGGFGLGEVWMALLWMALLLVPGAVTLLTFGFGVAGGPGRMDRPFWLAIGCGALVALVISILIGLASRNANRRVLMAVVAFGVSLFVGAFVFFGGCLLTLKKILP